MANLVAADNPQLTLQMEAMETSTPAHCSQWNTRHQQLLNNDKYLSEQIKETIENTGEKLEKSAIIDDLDTALAVTEAGVPVGCQAIQELNSNLNESLSGKVDGFASGSYAAVTGLAYDATNKKLGLKVGADTVIPFSSGGTITYIGRVGNSYGNASINIANKISNYSEITKDNIFIVPVSVSGYMNIADNKVGHSTSGTAYVSYSYNPSNGTVGISGLYGRSAIYGNTACTYQIDSLDVYVVQ